MAERKLTPEQKRAALIQAKAAGLCDGWHVEWDNRRKSKVWIAPGGVKTCWSLPQAVAWQIKVGIAKPTSLPSELAQKLHRQLTKEEIDVAQAEATRKGLPKGWRLEYDNRRGCKAWISPCGSRRCYTVGKAVAWSLEKGLVRLDQLPAVDTAMSEEEVAAANREAKDRGLSDEWKVEWNYRKGIRVWICPESGRRCFSIAEALRKQDSGDKSKKTTTTKKAKQSVTPEKCSPVDLPPGWTIEWDDAAKRDVFLSPKKDKRCLSIKEVLTWSLKNGLFSVDACQRSVQKKGQKSRLSEEEKRKALDLAKSQGLGDGWTVEWDKKSMQRVWYAPNRRKKCQSLPEALAWATKNTLGPDKISAYSAPNAGRAEVNSIKAPDSPKSDKLALLGSSLPSRTKRRNSEDSSSADEASSNKRQKPNPPIIGATSTLAGMANAIKPMAVTSEAALAASAPAPYPTTAFRSYQYSLASQLPPIGMGAAAAAAAAQQELLTRRLFARQQVLPSLELSSATAGLLPQLPSSYPGVDLLSLRTDPMIAARMAVQREMLLDAAIRRSTFPASPASSAGLGGYPFLG